MAGHEAGTIIASRYRLGRVLAQGGMGSIWVARHLQLDVDVALKFMAPEFADSSELRARFEREAKAAALLKSPNAVQVHDYGIEDGTPYIVMELLEGEDLSTRLAREGRLSLPATRRIVEDVGKALRRAHEIGLIHRDMKPANIFLARQAGEEVVKILDFGIAKSTRVLDGDQPTQANAVLGSPRYMSPEQVRSSADVDHRTDLWSLGVIAFRCLTGRLPFPDGEVGQVFVAICTAPIPRASEVAPDLGPAVDRFFERALDRSVDGRFQSAPELAEAFSALPGAGDSLVAPGSGARDGAAGRSHSADAAAEFLPTLPASGTLAHEPGTAPARRRAALLIVGGVAALGLVVALFWRGSQPPAAPPVVEQIAALTDVTPAPPPPASAIPESTPPPPAAQEQPPPPPAAKSVRPTHKSRRSGAAPRPSRSDDLLKHM
ncbi:serine/threonine-protein kinase [Nannocystis punicea]|uniref:Serine/threonine-protein kinase n=1 Tax=Nannocystis punicea TaxID=2995304 RepID=A0ABY7HG34_9BACT|nr:serine/threonine-protein kinase [Nannocystis poenicansa]WAS98042.1 serine/threonine-protein kinase [Nannocystis poenicansa]